MYPESFFIQSSVGVCCREEINSGDFEVRFAVVGEIEMSSYGCVYVVCYCVAVSIHALSEGLFGLSYILDLAFGTGDEINDFV